MLVKQFSIGVPPSYETSVNIELLTGPQPMETVFLDFQRARINDLYEQGSKPLNDIPLYWLVRPF